MRHQRWARGAVGVVLLLAACTPAADGSDEPPASVDGNGGSVANAQTLAPDAEIPAFSGPWASELERAYRGSTSDLQRTVLTDGSISDQEVAALQDDLRSCLEGQGFTGVEFDTGGGLSERPPDTMSESAHFAALDTCTEQAWGPTGGLVYSLAFEMRRKPANDDEAAVMVACLVRQELVPAGYTTEDYLRDAPADTLPFDTSAVEFSECIAAPLTAGTS